MKKENLYKVYKIAGFITKQHGGLWYESELDEVTKQLESEGYTVATKLKYRKFGRPKRKSQ